MKKDDRQAKAEWRIEITSRGAREECVMREFIAECRQHLTPATWDRYYPESEQVAGETFHIVEALVFALVQTQTPIAPSLRKALDTVIEECGIDRNQWDDLPLLNYDAYWRQQYGYDR